MKRFLILFVSMILALGFMGGYGLADKGEGIPPGPDEHVQGPVVMGTFVISEISSEPPRGDLSFVGTCTGETVTWYEPDWDHPSVINEENTLYLRIGGINPEHLPPNCYPAGKTSNQTLIINRILELTYNTPESADATLVTIDVIMPFVVNKGQ